jgi:transcriptional regulator with GAF, ATPase, and Fis domain
MCHHNVTSHFGRRLEELQYHCKMCLVGGTSLNTYIRCHLEDIELEASIKALDETGYNKTAAAKVMGMSFPASRYRMKKLGIV